MPFSALRALASASAFAVDPLLIVFDLPTGYTANSASMGVVDNIWVAAQVPEPASVATMLAGLAALGAAVRRRRQASRRPHA